MADPETVSALYKLKIVTSEALRAATDSALSDEPQTAFPIAESYTLNITAAVASHSEAAKALANPEAKEAFKRNMAMTAILLARPVKA